jgi:hypothetical protein
VADWTEDVKKEVQPKDANEAWVRAPRPIEPRKLSSVALRDRLRQGGYTRGIGVLALLITPLGLLMGVAWHFKATPEGHAVGNQFLSLAIGGFVCFLLARAAFLTAGRVIAAKSWYGALGEPLAVTACVLIIALLVWWCVARICRG